MDGHGLTTLTLMAARAVLADAAALGNRSRCYGGSSVWVAGWERDGGFGGRTVHCGEAPVGTGMVRVAGSAWARACKLMTG